MINVPCEWRRGVSIPVNYISVRIDSEFCRIKASIPALHFDGFSC